MIELVIAKSGIDQQQNFITKQELENELQLISRSISKKFEYYTEQFFSKFEFQLEQKVSKQEMKQAVDKRALKEDLQTVINSLQNSV